MLFEFRLLRSPGIFYIYASWSQKEEISRSISSKSTSGLDSISRCGSFGIVSVLQQFRATSSGAPAAKGHQAEPHTHIRKLKETHELIFSCVSWLAVLLVGAHDDDGVAQHGDHTPNNRLTEICSLDLPCTLILNIHVMDVMINWHLSKQGIHWPVSRDHIAGSIIQLIEITCFFEVDCWPNTGFWFDRGLKSD